MDDTPNSTFTDRHIWVRGLYMLFFGIAYSIAELLVGLIALFQFVVVLFTGSVDDRVLRFGRNLSEYAYRIWRFLTFNDEHMPFPFSPWPDEAPGDGPWRASPSRPPSASTSAAAASAGEAPEVRSAQSGSEPEAEPEPEPGAEAGAGAGHGSEAAEAPVATPPDGGTPVDRGADEAPGSAADEDGPERR